MEPVGYFAIFGTAVAGALATVFSPLSRKRSAASCKKAATVPEFGASSAQTETAPVSEEERVRNAMRQWASVRAETDIQYVRPPIAPPPLSYVIQTTIIPEPAEAVEQPASPSEPITSLTEPDAFADMDFQGVPNFYELLQISRRADLDTIHRVYRIMAARFHPDNPVSGDHERFLQLQAAYEVLSDAERRMQYDVALGRRELQALPIFGARVFEEGVDGETNRRFGVLALLYERRRLDHGSRGISVLDLERRMSVPREHLEFTLWYLRTKGLAKIVEENSDYTITVAGVDFVEANSSKNEILREVLRAAAPPVSTVARRGIARPVKRQGKFISRRSGSMGAGTAQSRRA